MDWFPLFNSLRIALLSSALVTVLGIAAAYYIAKLPPMAKNAADLALTLPLVLPPTAVGFLLLLFLGPHHLIGAAVLNAFGVKLTMQWWSAVFAVTAVVFPLMYRAARAAFGTFDETLADAARTLGLSNTYIFWHIRMPCCRRDIMAGIALTFARSLGEYGATNMVAGYSRQGATIATEVYRLWNAGEEGAAMRWVLVSIALSAAALIAVSRIGQRKKERRGQL